ncbi:TolC family protein [Hydrogenophaga electricum]|uniref:Transporter n=1 Tax=Hydrogenophaga electricum TaxID=1230953 RepID=A0ABQ6C3M7_9BURK|nr:TolC family protein [Hydrogenophaga electricum]GLS14497.1 hypothetical protein GCM10007935_19280 [Hydrogenophaga electricum]
MRPSVFKPPVRVVWLAIGLLAGPVHSADMVLARQMGTRSLIVSGQAVQVRQGLIRALGQHPEVLSARAAEETMGYQVDAARYARFPRLQLASGTGSTSAAVGGEKDYNVLSVSARMTLIDGGVIGSRIDAAEANSEASSAAVRSTQQKVALDALTAYMQVLRHDQKRAAAQRAIDALDELVRLEKRRVDLGATGENELRLALSRRATFAAKRQEFASQLAEARARFESYFGFVPDPSGLPDLALPAHWQALPTLEATWLVAQAQSSELAEARSRIDNAQALVRQQEAARFPSLDVVLAKTRDPRGVVYSDATRSGVELNWNFGNGFDLQLRIKSALAEVANQEARHEAARLNLQQLTSTAWNQAQAGRGKVEELGNAVREAGQVLQGRRRMLEVGREVLTQVLDAQVEYELQALDYLDAVADQRINELRVARVMGRLRPEDADVPWVGQIFAGHGQRTLALPAAPPPAAALAAAPAPGTEDTLAGLRLQPSYTLLAAR